MAAVVLAATGPVFCAGPDLATAARGLAAAVGQGAPMAVGAARALSRAASRHHEPALWYRMDRLWHRLIQAGDTAEGGAGLCR